MARVPLTPKETDHLIRCGALDGLGANRRAMLTAAKTNRIAAVLGCTAFENGDGEPPFVIEFDVGVAKLEPGQSAADALEVAAQLGQLQAG